MFLSKAGIISSFIYVGLINLQNCCVASDHLPTISNKSSGISQTADQFKLFNPTCDFSTIVVTADHGLNPPDVAEKMDHNLFVIVENGIIPNKKNQQITNLPPEKVLGFQLNHDHRDGDLFEIIVRYKNLAALDLENYYIPMGNYAWAGIKLSVRFLSAFQNLQILNLNRSVVFKADSVIAEILNDLQPAKNTLLSLNLSNAGVKSDPAEIKPYIPILIQFDQIVDLHMANNYLNPIDMDQISTNLINLERLNLSDNETIGSLGCMHITKLMNLTVLNLSNCDITVSDVEILNKLWQLRELDLSNNPLGGNYKLEKRLFSAINNFIKMEKINLSNTGIKTVFKLNLDNFTDLDLSYNKLKNVDSIIEGECGLINLKKLNLSNNKITEFSTFLITTLEDLDISYNKLINTFSLSPLEQLLNLRKLNLLGNTFRLYQNVREDISGAIVRLRNITSDNKGELII